MNPVVSKGSLTCVGIGITLGSHISPLSRSYIEQADVVFAGVSDGIVEQWLSQMHHDVRSLQPLYCEGKSRTGRYQQDARAGHRRFYWQTQKCLTV